MACDLPPTSNDVCVEWTVASTYTDGSAISRPVTYQVLRNGVPVTTTALVSITLVKEPLGRQCYRVVAIVDNVHSAQSNESCKHIRSPAPTDGSIEAPSDGSIEFPQ